MTEAPYIRFEMTYNGEAQGVGFMSGLDDTGMDDEEVGELLDTFNSHLAYPPYRKWESNANHFPGAYFTRAGYLHFKEEIHRIIDAVQFRKNGWDVIEVPSYGFPEEDVYYEDEHQVIAKIYHIENSLAS